MHPTDDPSHRSRRPIARAIALAVLCCAGVPAHATDLTPLLQAQGTTVNLSPATQYTIGNFLLTVGKAIVGNGAHIASTGPIGIDGAGLQLTIDGCHIDGTGWAVLTASGGASLVVQNGTQLGGDGTNTAIYATGSSVGVADTTLDHFTSGVQIENSDATLTNVVTTNTNYAVQGFAGTVTLDGCDLTNLDSATPGSGVDLHPSDKYPSRASTAAIRNTTFTGFGNAVGIQPATADGLPPGSAEIVGCTFNHPMVSAVIAVDAAMVHFASSRVLDAQTDGIYFQNSVALVEDAQVLNSLNTGVSFFGCPNGGMIRNSLVTGSAHQGVAVGLDPKHNRSSHGVRVVDNTLKDNVIANVLVADHSDAVVQGNVLVGSPTGSVRVDTSSSTALVGGLVLDSALGLEVKDHCQTDAALSVFTGHTDAGIMLRDSGAADVSHCTLDATALGAGGYAVDAAPHASVSIGRSSLGPAGAHGLRNRTGSTVTATYDYWGDPSGPHKKSGGGGAFISSMPGSRTRFAPFLSAPAVDSRIERAFALAADTPVSWQTDLGVAVGLTGASRIAPVTGIVAALRTSDASSLTSAAPPVGTFADGVVAVWIEYDLLSRLAAGSLRIHTSDAGATATLSHLDDDGQWRAVATTWDGAAGEIVYAPSDPKLLPGVFAFGDGKGCATARECLAPLVAGVPCAGPADARLQRAMGRKLSMAMAKLTQAAAGGSAGKLLYQARKSLQVIDALAAKALRKNAISADCRASIGSALSPALQRIDAGAP